MTSRRPSIPPQRKTFFVKMQAKFIKMILSQDLILRDGWDCVARTYEAVCPTCPKDSPCVRVSGSKYDCVTKNTTPKATPGKQPIRACYLGHVIGYQPIGDQYDCATKNTTPKATPCILICAN